MEISYMHNGDYLVPNLTLPDQPQPTYGKYGRMRKRYLQEYRTTLYNELLLSGKLIEHLNDVEAQTQEYLSRIVPEMARRQGIPEELKSRDQMTWVGTLNAIHAQVEEIILAEIVYTE